MRLFTAHGKQIIHRDLKPSNIMLTPLENGSFLVKVVDFGIARLLPRADTDEQKLTQTGELLEQSRLHESGAVHRTTHGCAF